MSSISPFSSNNDAFIAARLTSASAASTSGTTTSAAGTTTAPQDTVSIGQGHADAREVFQLGRVAYNQQSGNLTSSQATQLDSLIQQLQTTVTSDAQASGGTLTGAQAANINQLQNGLSGEIYADAHGDSAPPPVPAT